MIVRLSKKQCKRLLRLIEFARAADGYLSGPLYKACINAVESRDYFECRLIVDQIGRAGHCEVGDDILTRVDETLAIENLQIIRWPS